MPASSGESQSLLRLLSYLFGWVYTAAWSISFYPQPLLNHRRRSTSGTTPAFPILNTLGFAAYSISTVAFFASETIQRQYQDRHGGASNTVRSNDVVFALHALVLSALTLSQFWSSLWRYEQRRWKVSKETWSIVVGCIVGIVWVSGLVILEQPGWQWIDLIYALGYTKLLVSVVKYVPQVWANYQRQSTSGWSISQILLDLVGGVLSIAQLGIDCYRADDWSGLTGNPIKLGLGNVSILFDFIFVTQHYVLYREHEQDKPYLRSRSQSKDMQRFRDEENDV